MKMRKLLAGIAAAATLLGCAALGTASASADGTATITAVNAQQNSTYTAYKFAEFSNIQGDSSTGAIKSVDVSTVATGAYLDIIATAAKNAMNVADIPNEYKDNVAAYVATFTGTTLRKFASYVQAHIGDATNIGDFQGASLTTDADGAPTDRTLNLDKGEGWYLVTNTVSGESAPRSVAVVASTISGYQTMILSKDDGQNNIVELGKFNVKEENAPNAPHKYVYDGKMCDEGARITDNTTKLDGKSVSVGDALCYVVVTNVPKGAQGYDPYQMLIEDTASKGLTVDTSSVRAYHGDMAGTGLKMETNEYTVTSSNSAEGGKTMTVTVNDAHDWYGTKLWIVYKATVNEQAGSAAAVTLSNSAKVKHNATAASASWSEAGMTKQYVGSFNFTKVGPDKELLKNAKFAVYSGTQTTGTPLKFTKVDNGNDSWTYYYNPDGTETEVASDANGRVVVYGLKAKMTNGVEGDGKYTLKEIQAPTGYLNVESTMPVFTVEAQLNDNAGTLTATTGLESNNNTLNLATKTDTEGVRVKNVKSITQLPLTGGAGIILFSVIAALLVAVAAIVTVKIRFVRRELQD